MAADRPSPFVALALVLTLSGCASKGSVESAADTSTTGTPAVATAATINGKDPALTAVALLPRPEGPVPLRTPAQVMRVWIAPWEDSRGDLHAPGYLFTEITPRRWSLATPHEPLAGRRITPLQIERRDGASGPATSLQGDERLRDRGQTSAPPRAATPRSPTERIKS
jgi:conjugal transfer pilus assembly protein TraV